jgi:hypothetical protein
MEYVPDAWVILRIDYGSEIIHKVLGGWYGGYTAGDSWRLNSGITRVERDGDSRYRIHGYSGSTYLVHKDTQRTTMLMASIIDRLREAADVQVVDISDVGN